ncbi:MAG: helical backbone metal receptor [Thermodesulfovibrionales bacterium]
MKIIPVINPLRQAALVLIAALCLSAIPSTSWGGTPKRIISLAPNVTELLFALGLEENLIGVTDFCDYPEAAKRKRKIGGMSNPSLEAVVSLRPDLVILTTDGNPKEFKERLEAFNIRTYVVRSRRIQDLAQGIRDLGAVLAVSAKADRLATDIELTLRKYRNKKPAGQAKKILFIVWPEPLIAAGPGTVIDDALRLIGAENIAGRASAAYPKYSLEDILRTSPDLIIVGKGMGDVEKISEALFRRLKILPAVRDRKVFYVSDDLYRLGPRTIHGIDEISGLLEK